MAYFLCLMCDKTKDTIFYIFLHSLDYCILIRFLMVDQNVDVSRVMLDTVEKLKEKVKDRETMKMLDRIKGNFFVILQFYNEFSHYTSRSRETRG